jgi:hypothetical protein
MKNAILIITIIFGRLFHVNAQTIQNKKIEDFIYNHEISYNQKVNIIYREDIDSLIKILERNKISYAKSTFQFIGKEVNDTTLMGGESDAVILDEHKPFIYCRKEINESGIRLIIVSGHNYW